MNDGISQEEIDKLLAQAGAAEESSDSFNLADEKIAILFSKSFETVASALSVVISKDIEFKEQEIKGVKLSEFEKEDLGNFVVTEVPFAGSFDGINLLLLEKPFCSAAADLFLGGEGKKDRELNDETKNALKEIVNQIFGTLATAYSSGLGVSVNFDLNEIKLHFKDFEKKDSAKLSQLVRISYILDVSDFYKGKFIYLVSLTEVEKFYEHLNKQKEKEEVIPRKDFAGEFGSVVAPPKDLKQGKTEPTNIDLILDIELPINVRMGEAEITVHDVLQLCPGSIIELNKSVDEPVDVIVNNKLIAKGEVVVVDSYFALKITEIQSHAERIKSLGKE